MSEALSTLEIVFTSSVVAGVVSAFVSIWTAQRKISIENITKERKEWRDKVRDKSLHVHKAMIDRKDSELNNLKVEFMLILNPEDSSDNEDLEIIECIKMPGQGKELECSNVFSKKVSYLLKHDWERSKLEASSLFCRFKCINKFCTFIFHKPVRVKSKNC